MLFKFIFTSYLPPCLFRPHETKILFFWHFNLSTILFEHIKTDRRNVRRQNVPSPKRPIAELAVAETSRRRNGGRQNVPSPKRRRRMGVAETASPKCPRPDILAHFVVFGALNELPWRRRPYWCDYGWLGWRVMWYRCSPY